MSELGAAVLAGDVRAAARVCRKIDDRVPGHVELLQELYPHTGKAWIVGITGNPGAGKSTLTDRLIQALRARAQRVAVVAIDPTSPFSGGAILGDRIRMQQHFADPGVFIRSLATRGALGGLSRSATDVVRVLDAWGADVVLVETVGVGQDELEITRAAHTTLVVMAPGMGDDVQAIKAGILECADVFAVNKADRDGADATVRDLELMIALGSDALIRATRGKGHSAASVGAARDAVREATGAAWSPSIHKCVSTRNDGIDALLAGLDAHRTWLQSTDLGRERREARAREALLGTFRDALAEAAVDALGPLVEAAVAAVASREVDPYAACAGLIERYRLRP